MSKKNVLLGFKYHGMIFSFCLVTLLMFGLMRTVFASQRVLRDVRSLERIKETPSFVLSNIGKNLQQSSNGARINSKISGNLNFIIKSKEREALKEITSLQTETEKLNVIFELSSEGIDFNKLTSRGVVIENKHKNLLEVKIPIQDIEGIVSEFDEILYARLPKRFFPMEVTSEGVNLTGADRFHDDGYTGQGVKVAVIDMGFKGLSDAQDENDLPDTVITQDYTGEGLQTQYLHGTACAEIVYDMAPDAELYLFKIYDEMDIYDALDSCIFNNIDIITASIGTFGSGPGDGTGPICEAFEEARANGILVVAAAGNSANRDIGWGTHWKGPFLDSGFDDWWDGGTNDIHLFIPGDLGSSYNVIYAEPDYDDDGNPETSEVSILMRWNDWPDANVDYDLYLFDYFTGDLVASSASIQDGSQEPIEYIGVDLPDMAEDSYYVLEVTKKNGEPEGTELELFLGGTSFFIPFGSYLSAIATSSSTICEPADAQNVLTVGAISQAYWTTGPQEDFSSQGPTNAWAGSVARIKPDICGPDGVSGYTYGAVYFYGTSAATPHVAGAAALFLSEDPTRTADELQALLQSKAIDMGALGKDNIYGWGRLSLLEESEYGGGGEYDDGDDGFNSGSGFGEGGEGTSSGCFIATACYGTPMSEEVVTLKQFRDERLLTNPVGKVLVTAYYRISPPMAGFIKGHPVLKRVVRSTLKPLIWMSKKIID